MKKKSFYIVTVSILALATGIYSCAVEENPIPPEEPIINSEIESEVRTRVNDTVIAPEWEVIRIYFLDGGVYIEYASGTGMYVIDAVSVTANAKKQETNITYGHRPYNYLRITGLPSIIGGSSPVPDPVIPPSLDGPLALNLFNTIGLTDAQLESLEEMIKQIMNDCMGGRLYNALAINGKIDLTIDPGSTTSGFSPNGGIRLSSNSDSSSLIHEMLHAYQYSQKGSASWGDYGANREVEAHIAQYRYLKKRGDITPDSRWGQMFSMGYMNHAAHISDNHISKNGTLIDPSMSAVFNNIFETAALTIQDAYLKLGSFVYYDDARSASQNLSGLYELSKNC